MIELKRSKVALSEGIRQNIGNQDSKFIRPFFSTVQLVLAGNDVVLSAVQRLRPVAEGAGLSMAQLALAWVLREPNVSSAIIGATKPEQVADNAAASGVALDAGVLAAVDEVLAPAVR